MSDIQLLKDQISGLEAKLSALRSDHDLLKKAQGLHEQAAKAGAEKIALAEENLKIKADIKDLLTRKREAIQPTLSALSQQMSTILPEGEGRIEISDDGEVWIGWIRPDGAHIPMDGLSGGQRVPFECALGYALLGQGSNKILILEGAELDPIHLQKLVDHLALTAPDDIQVILNTCHAPASVPQSWKMEVIK